MAKFKNGKSKIIRLTSLFPTKGQKGKGYVGSVSGDYLDEFYTKVVKPAVKEGKGVTFFQKTWAKGENPVLSAAISTPYKGKKNYDGRERERQIERRPVDTRSEAERRRVR